MHSSCVFFKMSDLIFHYPRNYKSYPLVVRENDLVYDERYGKFTKTDVYYAPSKKKGKYPVFINVHGGGFVKGDKRHRSGLASELAMQGWFVFNINYRLAPKYPLPAGIEDTLNALNYVNSLADNRELDLDKIVISGDSAGAYYATAAVAAMNDLGMSESLSLPVYNGKIRALMCFCGLFDLMTILNRKTPLNVARDIASCLLGYTVKEDFSNINEFSYIKEINLLNYINGNWPETFILKAINDSFCGNQGDILEGKLRDAGVKIHTYYAKEYKEGHCFHLLPYKKATKIFMKDVFKSLDELRNS